jgi:uncharacterized membrane protein
MKKKYLLWCVVILTVTLTASLLGYPQLPERIPVHWNALGDIDRHGPRAAVFVPSGIVLLIMLLWAVLPRLSPQRFKVETFADTYWYTLVMIVGLLGYLQMVLLRGATLPALDMARAMLGGLAVFSILLGNVIGKVRRNFWVGIRTPWTLANERVWYSTHRLAARSMVMSGLLALAATGVGLPLVLALAVLVAGCLIPVPWSLLYYRRLERSGRLEGNNPRQERLP